MIRFCAAAAFSMALAALPAGTGWGQYVEETDSDQVTAAGELATPATEPDLQAVKRLIVEQTNEMRSEQGLPALESNPQLREAAQQFAEFIAETGQFGHTADGKRPSERAADAGYEYCIVLENLGTIYSSRGFTSEQSARRFMTGWKESPGHRENLVDPDVREIGIGIARGESGHYFAVQKFGRPRSDEIRFSVVNQAGSEVHYRLAGKGGDNIFMLPAGAQMQHSRCRPPSIQLVADEEADEESPQGESEEVSVEPEDQFIVRGDPGNLQLDRHNR